MKATVIISVDSNKTNFDNFAFFLSQYKCINDYEIIIVNDCADFLFDNTLFTSKDMKNVKIINAEHKLGYGAANNLAVENSSCDIIIFLNDDIILKENCLEKLIERLRSKCVGAVQPKLIYPQNNMIQSTGHIFTKYTNAHAFENISSNNSFVNKNYTRKALTTAVCATKKELFLKFGGFDTCYYNAWEGMEYTLKLSTNGYKCIYEHEAEAYHIRGGARTGYSLDENAQSALFWARWNDKIIEDLNETISLQLNPQMLNSSYILINFSKLTTCETTLQKCGIKISNVFSYTYNSGLKHVDFLRFVPTALLKSESNIIYFANNFTQIKNNKLWFELRKEYNDLIIDLSGNVLQISNLLPYS